MTSQRAMTAHSSTVALLALLAVYRRDGRATFRSVAVESGMSVSRTYDLFCLLRDEGLVGFEDDRQGTLRPLVEHAFDATVEARNESGRALRKQPRPRPTPDWGVDMAENNDIAAGVPHQPSGAR